jgi:hypothetical protein
MPTKKKITSKEIEKPQVSFVPHQALVAADPTSIQTKADGFNIGRVHILNKYWELANLDPEATKGNITGQLKALDSLCEELGLVKAAQEGEQSSGRQEIYRSAWMRRPFGGPPAGSA